MPDLPRRDRASLEPRKSPSQSRSAATVAAIVEAAARILESEGFAGYTTNAVAMRAGVSIGSLYQYFPNRDAITLALHRREAEALVARLEAIDNKAAVPLLRQLLLVAVRQQLERPALARVLDFEELRLGAASGLGDIGARAHAAVRRCLPAQGDEGGARLAADDVMAIVRGMVDAAGQRGEIDEESLLARVERAVGGYLGLATATR